ncbi:site-specific integrase [Sulfitobacter sp. HGT1]|uniref:site-specific integrase n=1 Tax=Sulfitobacter sp. HGT1 TaxID=2735435 RepID=UPI001593F748|nr:site-specific integrase [Sulfitobacter sp. HGT1]
MKDVSKSLYLVKRGEVWHYHRRVPIPLVHIIGKQFFKRSLSTKDFKAAQTLRNAYNVKVDAELLAAKNALTDASVDDRPSDPASLATLTEYLRQHIAGLDKREAEAQIADPPEDEHQRNEIKKDIEIALQTLRSRDNPNGAAWIDSTIEKLAKTQGANFEGMQVFTEFAEVIRRGLMELQHRNLDRINDRYDRSFHDPLFNPDRAPGVTFDELVKIFWTECSEEYRQNDVSPKRADKVRAELAFLLDAVGAKTPLTSISDDTVQEIRLILSKLPTNRIKHYPKLDLKGAIKQAEVDGIRPLNPVTQAQYLHTLGRVLAVGVRKGLMSHNPAADVKPIKKPKLLASEKRLPWTDDQIVGFFTGKFYQQCRPDATNPYNKPDRGWRFWVPLIMLLTGARPNEICQLFSSDIKQTPAGTWYLDLLATDEQEGQSIKTVSSRRRIPLHSELIKMGFLAFVTARKKKHGMKHAQLFPEITPDKYGNKAAYAARRFRDYFIPAEIALGERQTFYSLRHNVRDALRKAKAPADTLLAIAGWSPSGKATSDDYGDPGNPDLHHEWVEKISYPGLDLGFLYVDTEPGKKP